MVLIKLYKYVLWSHRMLSQWKVKRTVVSIYSSYSQFTLHIAHYVGTINNDIETKKKIRAKRTMNLKDSIKQKGSSLSIWIWICFKAVNQNVIKSEKAKGTPWSESRSLITNASYSESVQSFLLPSTMWYLLKLGIK